MSGRTAHVIGAGVAGGITLLVGFAVSFRARWAPALDAIRRFNRAVTNPRRLRTAGRRGDEAAVMHHVGRRTGAAYRTPVVAVEAGDGFLFALPYGPGADWVRNVLAGGAATVEHDGRAFPVVRPTLVPAAEADPFFDPTLRRVHRFFGVDTFLRVRRTSPTAAPTSREEEAR